MIRFVYFDLGNVLVGFSHDLAAAQLASVCGVSPERVQAELFGTQLQRSYELGELDTSQICETIRKKFGFQATDQQIESAISDIFWPNLQIVPLLSSLAATNMPLGILSNTCSAHWKWVNNRTLRWLDARFKTAVLSYEVHSMKPDLPIYRRAIEMACADPNEVFFVDDLQQNVEGARLAGMHAVQFTGASQLAHDLRAVGVQFNY